MDAKVWFIAAGKKKVGPLSTGRVLNRLQAGRMPAGALAWKEGMSRWLPLAEIEDFSSESGEVLPAEAEAEAEAPSSQETVEAIAGAAEQAVIEEAPEKAPAKPKSGRTKKKAKRKSKGSGSHGKAKKTSSKSEVAAGDAAEADTAEAGEAAELVPQGAFQPLYRIERKDVWRGYGLGFQRQRVGILLVSLALAGLAGGLIGGIGLLAGKLHFLLSLPFLGLAGLATLVIATVGLGALSYHSRQQLAEGPLPGIKEALTYALKRVPALTLPPVLLSVGWVVPVVLLGLISIALKIPYLGPVGTGLLFGLHIALSALALFLLLSAGMAVVFNPIVVAFEDTGVVASLKVLFDFVKRSTVRVVLWFALPGLAFTPVSALVLGLGACVLALPLGLTVLMAGPEAAGWLASGMSGDAPIGGLSVGLFPMVLWVGLFVCALLAVLSSIHNSLMSLLYLGGRRGNDELIGRDAYLAQRAQDARA